MYNWLFRHNSNTDLQVLNYGYAILNDDGVYLDNLKTDPVVLQYQLYDMAVLSIGGVNDLTYKTFIEVGCGRGGCFMYLVDKL